MVYFADFCISKDREKSTFFPANFKRSGKKVLFFPQISKDREKKYLFSCKFQKIGKKSTFFPGLEKTGKYDRKIIPYYLINSGEKGV